MLGGEAQMERLSEENWQKRRVKVMLIIATALIIATKITLVFFVPSPTIFGDEFGYLEMAQDQIRKRRGL